MPEETRSVIQSSIASMRQDSPADGGPEAAADSTPEVLTESPEEIDAPADVNEPDPAPAADAEPAADAKPAEAKKDDKPADDDDDFSKVEEFEQLSDGRKRVNRIPHPRVKKMIEGAEKRVREMVGKEYGEKLTAAEKRLADMDAIGEIMQREPERFMEILAQTNPAYQAWAKAEAREAAKAVPADDANDPEPQPDGTMSDGTPGYTPEQYKKYQAWERRQLRREVKAEMEADWKKKYGWIDDAKAAQDHAAVTLPAIRAQIEDAVKNWEDFEANHDAIVAELAADTAESKRTGKPPKLTLESAYRRVMLANRKKEREEHQKALDGLKTDRNKLREEILKELQGAPKSTAAVAGTHVVGKTDADEATAGDTKSVIRAAISRARKVPA
jgi:hypothetical protein